MDITNYITAAGAATIMGQASSAGGSNIRALAGAGKIPGAIKIGREWLIPRAWAEDRAAEKATRGRPVTTGAGVMRKDRGGPGGSPYATGNPTGRPKKTEPDKTE